MGLITGTQRHAVTFHICIINGFFPRFIIYHRIIIIQFSDIGRRTHLQPFDRLHSEPCGKILCIIMIFHAESGTIVYTYPIFQKIIVDRGLEQLTTHLQTHITATLVPTYISTETCQTLNDTTEVYRFINRR